MVKDSATRVYEVLRNRIATAAPGARLPSNRSLVAELGVGPVTVQRAVRQLSAAGLVESRPGVGTFVREQRRARLVDLGWQTAVLGPARGSTITALAASQRVVGPEALQLHSGYPARDLLPESLVRAALARASRAEVAITRSPPTGLAELRAWFAAEAAGVTSGGGPVARDAVVTAGSQIGLTSVFRALVGAGQPVVVESPTYWGAVLAARQTGVVLVPVATGPIGPDPEEVRRALRTTGARAVYVQPNFANPTGVQWPVETGAAVLDVVRHERAFLVEDDWAHDLGIDRPSRPLVAHDDDGHVVYLRSLTKSVSPALRVAVVLARGPARDRIVADHAAEAMYVSPVLQAAALEVVSHPRWGRHLRNLRVQLGRRRDALLEALRTAAPDLHVSGPPPGGLHLWAQLPEGLDVNEVTEACAATGLVVAPGTEWFPAEPSADFLRLGYASEDPARFGEAGRILGDVLTRLQ